MAARNRTLFFVEPMISKHNSKIGKWQRETSELILLYDQKYAPPKIYDGSFGSADPLHERRKICAAQQKFHCFGLHGTYYVVRPRTTSALQHFIKENLPSSSKKLH